MLLQVVAENIDSWRTNLFNRIELYNSTIADIKTTSNATSYACDLNARMNSSITSRIDSLAEGFNQLDIRTSRNRDDLMLVCGMVDQLRASSDAQFSILSKQLQVLPESSQAARSMEVPASRIEGTDTEHTMIIEGLCGKVKGLEQTIVTERNVVLGLRDMVVDLSERVDSSLSTAVISNPTNGSVLGDRLNITRERDIIRKGIEWSEKLILQLIATKIPTENVDISLIRKCNTIDLPALHSATKTCEKLKYLSFPGVDNSYCDHVSALLDKAEAWGSHIVQANTNAEVHSIKGSPGDVTNVGVFSDNADKTVFEFLESFELGYIG